MKNTKTIDIAIPKRKEWRNWQTIAQTPVTEKTDLKAQLAEVAERIRDHARDRKSAFPKKKWRSAPASRWRNTAALKAASMDFQRSRFTFLNVQSASVLNVAPTDLIKGTSPASFHIYRHPPPVEGLPIDAAVRALSLLQSCPAL